MRTEKESVQITTKKFNTKIDVVKMMRSIRQKISSETMNMNFDQFSKYISKKLQKSI